MSGLYKKISYLSNSPREVVQLNDKRPVVRSVTFRFVTAAGAEIRKESDL